MKCRDETPGTARESGGEVASARMFPGLLRQKITIPDRVPGYVHRRELLDRANPTHRRLTVLNASSGFGKTVLLAECCRMLRKVGVATAWVSLDEQDKPAVLDAYIAFACQEAGLNLLDVSNADQAPAIGPEGRIGLVMQEIQSFDAPFVIVFDELERLRRSASVSLLAFLLRCGPPNLHLAVACREVPDGFNVAGALLEGRAVAVETEDLRFSPAEVAQFFDLGLSRRALADEMERSGGWPLALRISRNTMERRAKGRGDIEKGLARNWIESRLFSDLGPGDRDFVLDLGVFGWIDAALLEEVLQRSDSMRRLESMAALTGLLEPSSGGAAGRWRLHPLLREYCAQQRFREAPERFGAIHRRIAAVRARRGETVLAMRHAIEGGDPYLAGDILEQAGGVRLWIRQGAAQLQEANGLLSEDAISRRPRLRLVRCMALTLSGRQHEARALFRACPRAAYQGGGDDADCGYSVDHFIVRVGMALYGGDSVGSDWLRTPLGDIDELVRSSHLDPQTHGHLEYARCVRHFVNGDFDLALERLAAARELLAGTQFTALYGELVKGQIEFLEGRAQSARSHYRRARRIARKHFLLDPVAASSCAIAMNEVTLECSLTSTVVEPPGLIRTLMSHGVSFSHFSTASNVLIDTRLRAGRVDEALAVADALLAYLRRTGLTTFVRLLAALRISVLVIAGRVEDAECAWRREMLPEESAGCVDLAVQSWREMEAVSEARVRLLTACKRFDEARSLVGELRGVAVERRFRRIEMRALSLSIMLEQRAGDMAATVRQLTEYLRLFADCPYALFLVRERATCAELLRKYVDLNVDRRCKQAARSLLAAMRRADDGSNRSLTEREREVLMLLAGRRDKEIADALGLSAHGVRYRLRKLFRKLDVANRIEAVRRAKELGLIPG